VVVYPSKRVVAVVKRFLGVRLYFFATNGANDLDRFVVIPATGFGGDDGEVLDGRGSELFGELEDVPIELRVVDADLVLVRVYVLGEFKST
jgi:hypothetical protein